MYSCLFHLSRQSPDSSIPTNIIQIHPFQLYRQSQGQPVLSDSLLRSDNMPVSRQQDTSIHEYHLYLTILSSYTATYLTASAVYITQHPSNVLRTSYLTGIPVYIALFQATYMYIHPSSSGYTLSRQQDTS